MNTIKCYIEIRDNNYWHALNIFGEVSYLCIKLDRGENLLYKNSYKGLPDTISNSVKSTINANNCKVFWTTILQLIRVRNQIHQDLLANEYSNKNKIITILSNFNILIGQITGIVNFFYNKTIDYSDIRIIFEVI